MAFAYNSFVINSLRVKQGDRVWLCASNHCIKELNKTWPKESGLIDENFVPSDDTKPAGFRTVVQNGEKSVYIENNTGTININ